MKTKNPFSDLTKFERTLWLFSLFMITAAFLIAKGDDLLSMIASLIGVTALIFVAKGYVLGQILTVVFACFYGVISFFFRYYGEMITYLGMTAPVAVFTAISWIRHPYKGTREVEVNRLTRKHLVMMILYAALTTLIFYFILSAMGNASILFSTFSVTTSFIASYLTFYRSPYYALGYAANDVILIILWIQAAALELSCLPMVVCFVMFLVNDLYGFINWRRMAKRQAK